MAKKRITGRKGLFGTEYYYDENGKYIGKSKNGLIAGTKAYYDERGRMVGKSRKSILDDEIDVTSIDGEHISSYPRANGRAHFKNGRYIGTTNELFSESYTDIESDEQYDEAEEDELILDDESITLTERQLKIIRTIKWIWFGLLVVVGTIAIIYTFVISKA